jgi:hypothetical protein
MSLTTIKTKIRSLVEDFEKTDSETFKYANSTIFPLAEDNIISVSKVTKNDATLGSGEWDYDSTNNEVSVSASLSNEDLITVYYSYYKYSDTELTGYIRNALGWISIYAHEETDFELEATSIEPTPTNKEEDLIAVVAAIIIKPNWSEYRLPNITVRYPRTEDKEKKIKRIIMEFRRGIGIFDVIDFSDYNT